MWITNPPLLSSEVESVQSWNSKDIAQGQILPRALECIQKAFPCIGSSSLTPHICHTWASFLWACWDHQTGMVTLLKLLPLHAVQCTFLVFPVMYLCIVLISQSFACSNSAKTVSMLSRISCICAVPQHSPPLGVWTLNYFGVLKEGVSSFCNCFTLARGTSPGRSTLVDMLVLSLTQPYQGEVLERWFFVTGWSVVWDSDKMESTWWNIIWKMRATRWEWHGLGG